MSSQGIAVEINQEGGPRRQDALPGFCPLTDAVQRLATNAGVEARGAIYTRIEVVEFILDLVGYTSNKKLSRYRILEPSFGGGDFLLPIIKRLLKSWSKSKDRISIDDLKTCVLAVELHRETFDETKDRVIELLQNYGLSGKESLELADAWLVNDDFLLLDYTNPFDFVVGNPPYVRQELIPDVLIREYRVRFETVYDRADLYIPFIEKSLKSLSKNGVLGFICADRWMKNKYGGPLRKLVSEKYQLKYYVDMVDTEAFHSEVSAYPAIMVITRERNAKTRLAIRPEVQKENLRSVAKSLTSSKLNGNNSEVLEMNNVASGSEPWLLGEYLLLPIIRRLEAEFAPLESVGCKVGIGVATGADKAFIGVHDEMDVEEDRKLPLAMTKDITGGIVNWRGYGVINPYSERGGLVDLDQYPKLKAYLEERREVISKRHCAKKTPGNWYKTIDRITPSLAGKKKLLIPDIKGSANIVYEPGKLYPHHNLYYVTSNTWNLRALQAVLLSDVTKAFIKSYSTQMRGGFLRYQAQYLRRIRLPDWDSVSKDIRTALIEAANKKDISLCNQAAYGLYQLSSAEIKALEGQGD